MIELENVSFSYRTDTFVLKNIGFEIKKGETLAIVGASGCGKSTLLRIISGLLSNNAEYKLTGRVLVDSKFPNDYRKSGKLSFMFQKPTLLPNLTVRENVNFPLSIKNNSSSSKVDELLRVVGLENYSNYLSKELSGGMETRVSLARSFAISPELLLLDEPFSALDISWKSKLYVELEKLKEQHDTTVIIVTHDVQEAILLANKVIILGKTGTIIEKINLNFELTIYNRLKDISNFNNTETFKSFYSHIQKCIMDDGVRNLT